MAQFTPNLHIPGAKDDDGKPIVEDVLGAFANALNLVAEIGTAGANKYTLHGWQHVPDGQARYFNAAGRHRLKRQGGEDVDPESGQLHMGHELWSMLAAVELNLRARKGEKQVGAVDSKPVPDSLLGEFLADAPAVLGRYSRVVLVDPALSPKGMKFDTTRSSSLVLRFGLGDHDGVPATVTKAHFSWSCAVYLDNSVAFRGISNGIGRHREIRIVCRDVVTAPPFPTGQPQV